MHYNLVKASNRRYLEELKNRGHEMKPLYDAVNIMQDTEWVINKRVYDVIVKLIETDNPKGMQIDGWIKFSYSSRRTLYLGNKDTNNSNTKYNTSKSLFCYCSS